MEPTNLTRADRLAMARQYQADDAIIQGAWTRQDAAGRHLVCALAAFGKPGEINGAADCPADVMPQWLAQLVPAIDDGIAADQVPWFFGQLVDHAERWHVLDDAAWDRIRTGFLIAGVRRAVEAATAVHQGEAPAYWPKVTAAADQVCTALQTGNGLAEAAAAAYAARAAAYAAADAAADAARAAAYAARAAAYAAADAAADAAAYAAAYAAADAAADAAAYAAADAAAYAAADAAAYAAADAAWKALAETLFALIDAELSVMMEGADHA